MSLKQWEETKEQVEMMSYQDIADLIYHLEYVKGNLEEQLQDSTDQNDLILDEFTRVKCLTDNTEIHQLCERAHLRMAQKVPVISRNKKLTELSAKVISQAKRVIRQESRKGNYECEIEKLDDLTDKLRDVL